MSGTYSVDADEGPRPGCIMGYVWVTSPGASHEDSDPPQDPEPFYSSEQHINEAKELVVDRGLTILAESRLGLAVAGPPDAYRRLTDADIVQVERFVHAEAGRRREVSHLDIQGAGQPKALGVGVPASPGTPIDAVILEQPRLAFFERPSPLPPPIARQHLRVPDDIASVLGAAQAHRNGHTGRGVVVAMVDSGHYKHPFFELHGYRVEPPVAVVPGTDPRIDPIGHGTGESANLFAVAPDVTLRPYRAADEAGRLVGAVAGFMLAKSAEPKPQIITNSWGGDRPFPPIQPLQPYDRAFAAEILDAVTQGILVVFAVGNGDFSFEPQIPGVLSAGGAFASAPDSFTASNYASAYTSPFYAERTVPDLCGLVGQRPRGQYLLLPVPPASQIDVEESQERPGDPADGTAPDDGWALFSGTSAAAPQIAGAAALILEARPRLRPEQVRQLLMENAKDITRGSVHPRFSAYARKGRDIATGAGLVDVYAALEKALGL